VKVCFIHTFIMCPPHFYYLRMSHTHTPGVGVAELVSHVGQHGVHDPWIHGRGGLHVEVQRRADETDTLPLNHCSNRRCQHMHVLGTRYTSVRQRGAEEWTRRPKGAQIRGLPEDSSSTGWGWAAAADMHLRGAVCAAVIHLAPWNRRCADFCSIFALSSLNPIEADAWSEGDAW
jgi:hypothetical protein